jgi:hypothetical protein
MSDRSPRSHRPGPRPRRAPIWVCYATQPGGVTLDGVRQPGNPFATALLEVADTRNMPMGKWPSALERLTTRESEGRQLVQAVGDIATPAWRFRTPKKEKPGARECLLLMVSDYSRAGLRSLPGAAVDGRRLGAMFRASGFHVTHAPGPERVRLLDSLEQFAERSEGSEIAVIYATGHGIHAHGRTCLLPGDAAGPLQRGSLRAQAISVTGMMNSARSGTQNVVFFAACRTRL